MNLPRKLAFLIFSLLIVARLLQAKIVGAQIPPGNVPCGDVRDPEFHSLRPYQANPCDEEIHETALFCGNDLVIPEEITVSKGNAISCEKNAEGNDVCKFREDNIQRKIAIDLSNAKLPIMGNTEDAINSQQQEKDLSDAEKVNEYVSWYLNGIINRAEYPFLDPTDEEDISKIVDFSGPLKKLLPWDEQVRKRIKTIERAVGKDVNKDGQTENQDRHDQVFACTFGIPIKLFGIWEVARAAQIPVPCYDKSFLSLAADFFDLRDEKRLSEWRNHLPPLAEDFDNFQDYWVEYKKWRGERCVVAEVPGFVPVVGGKKFVYCFDDPTKPNYWANLFPYIPFSSTEDRVGQVEVSSVGISANSEDIVISDVALTGQSPAELFFAHMQESNELADLLQQTYVPKDNPREGPPVGVYATKYCDIAQIRSNPGDNLFAGEISGTLSYTAEFTCDFEVFSSPPATNCNLFVGQCVTSEWSCDYSYGQMDCPQGFECKVNCSPPPQDCTKKFNVNLSVITKTPKADELWSRLVAGPSSAFKRIYPQADLETGPIACLVDIPASTKVTYSDDVIYAGNPTTKRSAESAELYFPHLGGIYEYFLKGIQTALRPKGFGEQAITQGIPGDPFCVLGSVSGDICTTDCNVNPTNVKMAGVKDNFLRLAKGWFGSGVGNPRVDKFDRVVNSSISAGIDPIFTLAIWIKESGASNYEGACKMWGGGPDSPACRRAQDFGINVKNLETVHDAKGNIIEDHFEDQLRHYLGLPGYYLNQCTATEAGCWMAAFGAKFRTGSCNPNTMSSTYPKETGADYITQVKEIYKMLAPKQKFPCYPIRLP